MDDLLIDPIEEKLYMLTSIAQEDTGLPVVMWVYGAEFLTDLPIVKFQNSYTEDMDIDSFVSVTISNFPQVLGKPKLVITEDDLEDIFDWIVLNKKALLRHFNQKTDSSELFEEIKALPNKTKLVAMPNFRQHRTKLPAIVWAGPEVSQHGLE